MSLQENSPFSFVKSSPLSQLEHHSFTLHVTTWKFSLKIMGRHLWTDAQFWGNVEICKPDNAIYWSFAFQKRYTEILSDSLHCLRTFGNAADCHLK